ncbi:MAG: lysophospholipid acyltransferase family protein [Proteobacteria bacterium]|nr:lysophospholipid acyltransferase family protein [Pseudomonadota bacterium]
MWFLRIIAFALYVLPPSTAEFFARALVSIVFPFLRRDVKVICENATKVLNLDAATSRQFAKDVLTSQIAIYLETILFVFYPDAVTFDGIESYHRNVSDLTSGTPSGIVTFTAHLGSWELAGYFATLAAKRPMYVLAKPSRTTWINPILDGMRQKLKMNVLWTHSKSLLRDMLSTLERGDGLGFVMDQKPANRSGGCPVNFMGVPNTPIVQGPAQMIAKKGCAVFGSYCVRIGARHYRVISTKTLSVNHGLTDLQKISELLALDMESIIRQYPVQWAWNYKRWKW